MVMFELFCEHCNYGDSHFISQFDKMLIHLCDVCDATDRETHVWGYEIERLHAIVTKENVEEMVVQVGNGGRIKLWRWG
jgi:hypothetical protein